MTPRIMLATLCLNEMEWLPKLVQQHVNWPGVVGWAFVEGVDPEYAKTNLEMLCPMRGLSSDGTTDYLLSLSSTSPNFIRYVPRPASIYEDNKTINPYSPDQQKCGMRNDYWAVSDAVCPDWVVQLDADEFYSHQDQQRLTDLLSDVNYEYDAFMFRQRHIWKPPVLDGELFSHEVVGGYWQVPHTRVWRWRPGTRHVRNHNWPERGGKYLTENMLRCDLMDNQQSLPQCVHLGYASSEKTRKAKHGYYVARGEGSEGGRVGRRRRMYLDCREAWENWDGFRALPHGARVRRYDGPIPEVFR